MRLLDDLTALNERLYEALQADDVAAFEAGLGEREKMMTDLAAYGHPAYITPDWMVYRITLAEQHRRLEAALAHTQARLLDACTNLDRYHRAQRSYRLPSPSARILNKNLCG
jgi:hypothetical protein